MFALLTKLKQAYPLPVGGRSAVISITLVVVVVTLIFLLFSPSGLQPLNDENEFLLVVLCGVGAWIAGLIYRVFITGLINKSIRESSWIAGYQILYEIVYLMWIATAVFGVAYYLGAVQLALYEFLLFQLLTGVLGAIPLAIKILVRQNQLLKKNLSSLQLAMQAAQQESETKQTATKEESVVITAITQDSFDLKVDDCLFIEAQQSYSEIFYLNQGQVESYLIRQNIGKLEEQLSETQIKRVHRSYLVNVNCVKSVSGNAQGYQLEISKGKTKIPLSRAKAKQILPLLTRD